MTEFRTRGKGKERKVYPVKKRQAFGVSRNLAYDEVQALREQGKRARLIQTNRTLNLYAPYEAMVNPNAPAPPEPVAMQQGPANTQSTEPNVKTPSVKNPSAGMDAEYRSALESLGILSGNGKLNMNMSEFREYFHDDANITVQNGIMTLRSVDPAYVSMMEETLETNLPDGDYAIVLDGKSASLKMLQAGDLPPRRVKLPALSYGDDSWRVRLEGESLSKFIGALKGDEQIQFRMLKNQVEVYRLGTDQEGKRKKEIIEAVPADTNWEYTGDIHAREAPEIRSTFSSEYTGEMIRAMMGRKLSRNPGPAVLTLDLRQDYPMTMSTRKLGPGNSRIEAKGIIAPRIE